MYFGKREIHQADDDLALNRKANHSENEKLIRIAHDNWIDNNPITVGDIKRSQNMYGHPIPTL